MKNIIIAYTLLISFLGFSSIDPELEKVGKLVKATYYYDNGSIEQQGFFKNGKLDGKWISYYQTGKIKTIAYYENGVKTGNWITYSSINDSSTTIVYLQNNILKNNNTTIARN